MKKTVVCTIIFCILFSLCCCTPALTGKNEPELVQKPRMGVQFMITQEQFPVIGATGNAYGLAEDFFNSIFQSDGTYDIKQHPLYPKKYENEQELIKALKNKTISVAFTEKPRSVRENWDGMTAVKLTTEALVFLTSADNPVKTLTGDQLKDIFSGKVTDWSEVGSVKGKISFLGKDSVYTSAERLMQLSLLPEYKASGTNSEAVTWAERNMSARCEYHNGSDFILEPAAFSQYYLNLTISGNPDGIIAVDGKTVTTESIISGEYPFVIDTYMLITDSGYSQFCHELRKWAETDTELTVVSGRGAVEYPIGRLGSFESFQYGE